MCTSTAQARKICLPAAGASGDCALVVVPCAFRYMVVIVEELRFRDRCSESGLWTCGSFANFVAGTALCDPRCTDFVAGAALGEPQSVDFVTGTALCEPRSADFVADAALGEPRSADFVTGTALCEPRSADFMTGPALVVNHEVQISWQAQHLVNLNY